MSSQKIAVMKFSALGDIAASLPLLRFFDPAPCIITSPLGQAFLKDEFSDFILLPDKSIKSQFKLIREVRKRGFSDLIDLQGNDRCRFFSRAITFGTRLTSHNGYDPRYKSYSKMVAQLRKELENSRVFEPKPCNYIVLNTGSSAKWSAKRPPAWKWREFATELDARFGLPFKLTGSADEIDFVNSIAEELPFKTEVLAGKTTLGELKELLRNAFLTVSTDSAALHISAAEGTPTIGIFGSTTQLATPDVAWATGLWDHHYYPEGQLPKCTNVIDNYYDNIDLTEGLKKLEPFLSAK